MTRPIFYDPTGKRSRRAKRTLAAVAALGLLAITLFATTLVFVPKAKNLSLPLKQPHAEALRGMPSHGLLGHWLPDISARSSSKPLTVGFYLPDDETSIASLRRHADSLDWVVPATVTIAANGAVAQVDDRNFDRLIAAMPHPPAVLPLVQNYSREKFNGTAMAAVLESPKRRSLLASQLGLIGRRRGIAGLALDIEDLPEAAMPSYVRFLGELRRALPKNAQIAVNVPAGNAAWPVAQIAREADRVMLMAYDQHWQGGQAGPVAGQDWFVRQVAHALRLIGAGKLVVGMASYGYDWSPGNVEVQTIEEAWLSAHDSEAAPIFDPNSGNTAFAYDDESGARHMVWMVDAAASWNQFQALKRLGVRAVGLWRLGSEDPGYWHALRAFRRGGLPLLERIESPLNNDVEGNGEIIRVVDVAHPGSRSIDFGENGLVVDERYTTMPTPYVVARSGASDPRALALTFDDGPDEKWTPKILDILEREHVPATFFVIGENALEHPDDLRRMIADGDVIGNHTYTHPNLAGASRADTDFEIDTTQRLVEAYTGHRMRLFRAPYFGDAEPTTADELLPALRAQEAGYTIVGLHVDPGDWRRTTARNIVAQVLSNLHSPQKNRSANVILLHDGGGDRSQTVLALPQMISQLKAEGYHFVTAPSLIGVSNSEAMPLITGSDRTAARIDMAAFLTLAGIMLAMSFVFYIAISLGIARAVVLTALAWWQSRARRGEPAAATPSVTVIIPAFNEAKVIVASVAQVLASEYQGLQVIVADDGSTDGTSARVAAAFGFDPRVRLLTLSNGGKAAALNRALAVATGEIVIALDADTQFEPLTIARLVRWFADPQIGAVAGDARVGNRINLVTRWQAVEYITAQNLERRALAGFDAMTVVPGAVGAWRRAALDEVGGYPEDTLAEDQDLTIEIQRAGWRVTYDPRATAWTEAPETFRALARQRYRWAFGTLQCLWKHRAVIGNGRPTGLALIGMPQAWVFQIVFAAISPLIDLALVLSVVATALRVSQHGWEQTRGDVGMMGLYWMAFTAIDVICGWIAYRLDDRRPRYPAHLLIAQRIVYRQIMYWVVLRALASAIGGWVVGWGKLERSGRVEATT